MTPRPIPQGPVALPGQGLRSGDHAPSKIVALEGKPNPFWIISLSYCSNRTLTDWPSWVRLMASASAGATDRTVSLG
jgi:hypothetical protein